MTFEDEDERKEKVEVGSEGDLIADESDDKFSLVCFRSCRINKSRLWRQSR